MLLRRVPPARKFQNRNHKLRTSRLVFTLVGFALLLGCGAALGAGQSAPPPSPSPSVNTTAGGLTALPPAEALGNNVVANSSLAAGTSGWSLPDCFSIDSVSPNQGSSSLRFTAGSSCQSGIASTSVTRGPNAVRSYTLQGWIKTSAASDITVKLTIHDQNCGGDIIAGVPATTPGPTWTFIQRKDIDLLPIHDGHTLSVYAVVKGTTGMAWVNNVQLIEQKPLPISAFLLYPNYKGYLWGNGPQTIRLQVEVPNPAGMKVSGVLQAEGGKTITTLQQPAQSSQELDFDGSGLATGNYLLETSLLDGNGKTAAVYPSYRVKKVDPGFQSTLVNYIDNDNFLVRNGQKHFVWGIYDRWSAHLCGATGGIPCLSTNESTYLQIPGFNGLSTVGSYADTLLNSEMNILPFAGVNPSPTADQLTPWLAAVNSVGVGHLQIVNNWVTGNRYRPIWAKGISDSQMWQTLASTQTGVAGGLGYYTYDEPSTDVIPTIFGQWPILSAGDPGGVLFGTLAKYNQVFRWRDMADVMSADPYPVGNRPDATDFAYGERATPPMMKTSIATREVVRQSSGSRPVWIVPQLFVLNGKFPTYAQMKMQAYKAIINGATGLVWWGFVSEKGIEYEWYSVANQQPYFDFKRLSQEVMGLEPILISAPRPDLLASVSDPRIERLVKEDATRIVIFASNFSDATVGNVTFNLSTASSSVPIQVYSEGRNLGLTRSSFTDSFAPGDVHVYVVTK